MAGSLLKPGLLGYNVVRAWIFNKALVSAGNFYTTVAGEHELYCCQVEVEVYPYCRVGLGVPDSCVIFTDSAVGVVALLYAKMKALFLNLPSSDKTVAGMRVSCYC